MRRDLYLNISVKFDFLLARFYDIVGPLSYDKFMLKPLFKKEINSKHSFSFHLNKCYSLVIFLLK